MLKRNLVLLLIVALTCCACSQSPTADYPQDAPLSPRNQDKSETVDRAASDLKKEGLKEPEEVYKDNGNIITPKGKW
jgi:hypothetical protein